jgi:cytochrome c556
MKFRTVIVATAFMLGAYAAVAQVDAIATRKSVMKGVGDQTKIGAGMAKGEVPYDQTKAVAIFTTYVEASEKMPTLFPDNSKTGGETAALPAIWEHFDDVKAKFAKFGADAKAALASVKDLDSFKAAFGPVTKNCGGCHENYRAKKS